MRVKLTILNGVFDVFAPYHPEFVLAARRLKGTWNSKRLCWRFDLSFLMQIKQALLAIYGEDGTPQSFYRVELRYDNLPPQTDFYDLGRQIYRYRRGQVHLGAGVVQLDVHHRYEVSGVSEHILNHWSSYSVGELLRVEQEEEVNDARLLRQIATLVCRLSPAAAEPFLPLLPVADHTFSLTTNRIAHSATEALQLFQELENLCSCSLLVQYEAGQVVVGGAIRSHLKDIVRRLALAYGLKTTCVLEFRQLEGALTLQIQYPDSESVSVQIVL